MGAPTQDMTASAQWIFPIEALHHTPSVDTSNYTVAKELYDRARGVEFLFRLGSSLGLSEFTATVPSQSFDSTLIFSVGRPRQCSPPQLGSIASS